MKELNTTSISETTAAAFAAWYALGTILLGIGGFIGYSSDHSDLALSFVLLGVLFAVVGIVLKIRAAKQAEYAKLVSPIPDLPNIMGDSAVDDALAKIAEHLAATNNSKTSDQVRFPTFRQRTDRLTVDLGGTTRIMQMAELRVRPIFPIEVDQWKPLMMYVNRDDDQLFVTADIFIPGTNRPFRISASGYDPLPPGYDVNANSVAFELVDKNAKPVFQIIRRSESHISIKGLLMRPDSPIIILDDDKLQIVPKDADVSYKISRIFRYPAWKFPGEYDHAE